MSGLPLWRALDSGRLLRVAALVAFLEVAVRVALGVAVHPFLYLLAPPVVAIGGVGMLASGLRTGVLDERRRYAAGTADGILPRLVVVAVVGHAFAVTAGLVVFVLLDTPLQAALYGVGSGVRQPLVSLAWPVVGLVAGTAVAWTLPALVAAGVSEGFGLRRATRRAVVAARERATAPVLGVMGLAVLGILGACALGAALGYVAASGRVVFVAAGSLTVLFVTPPLAVLILADLEAVRSVATGERAGRETPLPVGRLAVAVLLVASLATLAGGVRMAEMRPMESPDPLGEDPDDLYATALENTLAGSHTVEWVVDPGTEGERTIAVHLDREDRQYLVEPTPVVNYVSTGTQTFGSTSRLSDGLRWVLADDSGAVRNGGVHTPPNYFAWATDPTAGIVGDLPLAATGWERVGTDGDEVTLELTDERAVLAFVGPTLAPGRLDSVDEASARAVVDTETRRLTTVDLTFNATVEPDDRLSVDERYTFEAGTDVERPDSIGSPSPEAYVWRLLLY
jgi:hypothetical protein